MESKLRSNARLWLPALCLLAAGAAWPQSAQDMLKSYQRNFAIASLESKVQVVRDAGSSGVAGLGPLYLQAVDYVLTNFSYLESDQRYRTLAVAAVDLARSSGYAEARYSIWNLFKTDSAQDVRVSCLNALAVIGKGDAEISQNLNLWVQAQNSVLQTGKAPEPAVILAAVKALGSLGDPAAFPTLFSVMNLGYPTEITRQAHESLLALPVDDRQVFLDILRDGPPAEKKAALAMALESPRLSEAGKGEVAEFALEVGLHTAAADKQSKGASLDLRLAAAKALIGRRWSQATPLAIEHFDAALQEYGSGLVDKRHLVEAIELLGDMASHEAAVRLTRYLASLNTYTEKVRAADETIVLPVIRALGALHDRVAFDDLLFVGSLKSYSAAVKSEAARVRAALYQ
jgi:hypothetical protein